MKLLKVYAANRADRQAERLEVMNKYNQQKAQAQSERDAYKMQNRMFEGSMINAVKDGLGQYADGLDIRINNYYDEGFQVHIDNGDDPYKEGQALSWRVDVNLDSDGNVKFDTSSWSGLNATDESHIADLWRTVEILDTIQHMDWKFILDRVGPKWEDYVKTPEPEDPSKQFAIEDAMEDISNSIGRSILIKGLNPIKGKYDSVWYKFTSEGPSTYGAKYLSPYYVNGASSSEIERMFQNARTTRIPKAEIGKYVKIPVEEMTY